jgi:hypothetical protein
MFLCPKVYRMDSEAHRGGNSHLGKLSSPDPHAYHLSLKDSVNSISGKHMEAGNLSGRDGRYKGSKAGDRGVFGEIPSVGMWRYVGLRDARRG